MMKFFLLLLLVSLVYSQTYSVWSARTIVTSDQTGSGYFEATVTYDWTAGMMRVQFDNASLYTEFYVFNVDKGYNKNVLTGQFTYQYLYKTSQICPCETNGLQDGMPAWFPSSVTAKDSFSGNNYWVTGTNGAALLDTTSLANGVKGLVYYANPALAVTLPGGTSKSYYVSNKFWVSQDGTTPVGFQLTDFASSLQRTFTITSLNVITTGTLKSQVPSTSCPCSKLIDLVISLDRSGSITIPQWQLEYAFVKNITQAFSYGPLAVNFGLVNWNANQWTTIDITAGTSATAVNTAINNMACCPNTASPSCCCCGTPIGGGIWAGGNMLSNGRDKATKVLIVLTDGCQNHLWQATPTPQAIACACSSEKACSTNTTCTSDITKWYNWVMQNVPGTKIIAIGVGDSTTICTDQLLLAAGGDPTAVYNPQSWADLTTIVNTISATACSVNAVPCTDCCGLCTCGICIPAPKCFNPDKCHIGVFDKTSQCCQTQPITCTPGPCQTAACDNSIGCVNTSVTCKDPETCTEWFCDATTIVCQQRAKSPLPAQCSNVTVPQCVSNSDCAQGDPCKVYVCVNSTGKCSISALDCGLTDKCFTRYCKPGVGCQVINKTCTDSNVCTTDTCDPAVGCVFTDISSQCAPSTDGCKKSICDPIVGCIEVPINCSDYGFEASEVNCTVPQCNKTCYNQYVCYAPPPTSAETFPQTVIIGSALGAAAVVGIVIGAAVLVAGLGTAAGVAIAGAAGAGGVALVSHNPTYVPSGASGNNVLFKPKD